MAAPTPRFQWIRAGATNLVIDTLTGLPVQGAVYGSAAEARGHADGMNLSAPSAPSARSVSAVLLAELLEDVDSDEWRAKSYAERARYIAACLDGCSAL